MSSATSLDRTRPTVSVAVDAACARIAPTWPLDQFIAVNPYWGWVDKPFPDVAAALAHLSGTSMWPGRAHHLARWKAGELRAEHLQAALAAPVTQGEIGRAHV